MKWYKDWWFWTFWIILLICIQDIVFNLDTLVRWKWGYWSIDMIPPILIILFLGYANILISNMRRDRWIEELQTRITKLEKGGAE